MEVVESTIIVPVCAGRVLLLQRRLDDRSYPGKFCFPGGRLDVGERPLVAAARKLSEEVGLHLRTPMSMGIADSVLKVCNRIYKIHRFLTVYEELVCPTLSNEHMGFVWLLPEDAKALPLAGPVTRNTLDLVPITLEIRDS